MKNTLAAENGNGNQVDGEIYALQSRIFKAFANPIRLELLDLLAERDWFASELQECLGMTSATFTSATYKVKAA